KVRGELFVGRTFDGLEVSPASELTHQLLCRKAAELILGDRETDHRTGLGRETGGGIFLEEWHVGVSIESAHHTGFSTCGELFDFSHDLLVVGVPEWSVFTGGDDLAAVILLETTTDVFDRDSFAEKIFQQNEVGG